MNLRPLPGHMIVKLESLYRDNGGPIAIPERYKKAPHLIGRITAISMRSIDHQTLGSELIVGNRILVTPLGGRKLPEENSWLYPITLKRKDEHGKSYRDSGVLAIIAGDVDLKAHTQDISRCQWCGQVNNSNQNVIMFNGRCPRCGLNANGEKSDHSIRTSADSLWENYEENEAESAHKHVEQLRRNHRKIPKVFYDRKLA